MAQHTTDSTGLGPATADLSTNGGAGRAAAFFDLDRTLMAGASAFHFGRAAYRAGMISRGQILSDAYHQLRFRLEGSTDELAQALCDRILASIDGHSLSELSRLAPEVLAGILPRIYPQMLDVVRWHQDSGRSAYIATAAWQEMSDLLSDVLAMDGAIATRSEIVDGVYTGRLTGPFTYGKGKADAVREFAADNKIDLGQSYAYSDSASDLPLLEAVGHPVVVNPDRELREVATTMGWEVLHFEKLARRMLVAASVVAVVAIGGSGSWLAGRRRTRSTRMRRRVDAFRSN